MSSDAHLRRDHGTQTSSDPFIDWGPDLPGRYDGGRARLLVANPRALFLTWESGSTPKAWRLEVDGGGQRLRDIELPGTAGDAWIPVPAKTRGVVRLMHDAHVVATLPFETPQDGPSDDTTELWGRVDDHGQVRPAASIGGTGIGPEAIAPGAHPTSRGAAEGSLAPPGLRRP